MLEMCPDCNSKLEVVSNNAYVNGDGFIDGDIVLECPNCEFGVSCDVYE